MSEGLKPELGSVGVRGGCGLSFPYTESPGWSSSLDQFLPFEGQLEGGSKPEGTGGMIWKGPLGGPVSTNPGNSRANDEHISETGVGFSVSSIELGWKAVSGS